MPRKKGSKMPPIEVPPACLLWLRKEYVEDSNGKIARSTLYEEYEQLCKDVGLRPKSPNIFGRMLLQVFPELRTVRVGSSRCQVYYYGGLRKKEQEEKENEEGEKQSCEKMDPATSDPRRVYPIERVLLRPKKEEKEKECEYKKVEEETEKEENEELEPLDVKKTSSYFRKRKQMEGNTTITTTSTTSTTTNTPTTKWLVKGEKREKEEKEETTPHTVYLIQMQREIQEWQREREERKRREREIGEWEIQDLEIRKTDSSNIFSALDDRFDLVLEPINDQQPEEIDRIKERFMNLFLSAYVRWVPNETDLLHLARIRRYSDVFVTILWPFTPLHRAVANETILDNCREEEKDVLALNLSIVISTGASMLGEYDVAFDLFRYCQTIVTYVHDSVDRNIVQPLIVMACGTLNFFPFQQAVKLAAGYLMIAETICELLNETESESYQSAVNLHSFLTNGERPALAAKRYPVMELVSNSNLSITSDSSRLNELIKARTAVRHCVGIHSYITHAAFEVTRAKTEQPDMRDQILRNTRPQFRSMRNKSLLSMKDSKAALTKNTSACYIFMKVQYHAACAESYLAVENVKKALKHQVCLLRLIQSWPMNIGFLHAGTAPVTFFRAKRKDLLEEFIALCQPLSQFHNICGLMEMAKHFHSQL